MNRSVNSERRDSESSPADETYNIFINNVDSFNGKYILSSLYKQGFDEIASSEEEQDDNNENNLEENPESSSEKTKTFESDEEVQAKEESLTFDQIFSTKAQGPRVVSKYKIFGSSGSPLSKQKPEEVFEMTAENNEKFKYIITKCHCVIYDISLDETQICKALNALAIIEQDIERQKSSATRQSSPPVLFILISTCMTWALTPRMNPNDPDPIPFVESDHRRRKPHPNFKEHYDCEMEVMKKGKKFKRRLCTIVLCSGVTYGYEENMLAFLFKRAWSNDQYLPIFEEGTNFIPLIHVDDLTQIICKLIDYNIMENQYILAVEQTPACLKYIVKYISRALGSGRIKYVDAEEAYLYPDIDHNIFDCLTANIAIEPEFIISSLGIPWKSEMNFVENIEMVVEEFKTHRNLEPLKILVLGPPCVGKTKLANLLCDHYNLHYISVKAILDSNEFNTSREKNSSHPSHSNLIPTSRSKTVVKEFETLKIDMEDVEQLIDQEDAEDLLDLDFQDSEEENYHKTLMEENRKCLPRDYPESVSRLSDEYVVLLIRNEMLKNHSQNLGFVIDGFPKTLREATWLFWNEGHRYSSTLDDPTRPNLKYDKRLIPNYVINLDAPNSFLLDRISKVPEEFIQNTHYNERDMIRRLLSYRERNTKESSPLTYFSHCDTETIEINVSEFPSEDMECIFYICTKLIGPPRGFGPSDTEIKEYEVVQEYREKLQKEKEGLEKRLQDQSEKNELDMKMKKLMEKYHLDNVRLERILAPKIEQYRTFIAKDILPVVFRAIMNVVETKPDNPIDFLAEYLFKNNTNGRMYNPRYTRNGEKLIEHDFS